MKTFYLKLLTIITALIGIYLSLNYYYTHTQYKNFQIINERQAVIVQLPNAEYIEIASRNDHITDYEDLFEKPFSVNSKIQKNSNLENSIVRTDTYREYVENGEENKREITITPTDKNSLNIDIDIQTAYMYVEGLKYNIQLDYSNRTDFKEENGYVYFEDKGCRVEIHDEKLDYDVFENNQTVILSREYDLEIQYYIKLIIDCEKQ
jgi:hypothetical protein